MAGLTVKGATTITGLDASSGKALSGFDHVVQSIRDILTTPIGSRVMRREYGSELPELIDRPLGPELTIRLYAAVATALERWEPRFRLTRVQLEAGSADGRASLALSGVYLPDGRDIRIEGLVV